MYTKDTFNSLHRVNRGSLWYQTVIPKEGFIFICTFGKDKCNHCGPPHTQFFLVLNKIWQSYLLFVSLHGYLNPLSIQ